MFDFNNIQGLQSNTTQFYFIFTQGIIIIHTFFFTILNVRMLPVYLLCTLQGCVLGFPLAAWHHQ